MIGAIIARKAIKSGYKALNQKDIDKFMSTWDENCVWIYPGRVSAGGQFTGKPEVRKWFEKFQEQFPKQKFTLNHIGVGNIFAMAGDNVISAEWDLEVTNKNGINFTNSGVTLLTIKGSKVIKGQDFLTISDGADYKTAWGE